MRNKASNFLIPAINLLYVEGATSVFTIAENISYTIELSSGGNTAALQLGMDFLGQNTLPDYSTIDPDTYESLAAEAVEQIMDADPDVLILSSYVFCNLIMKGMYENNYIPKAIINTGPCIVEINSNYTKYMIITGTQWHREANGFGYSENGLQRYQHFPFDEDQTSPEKFYEEYEKRFGRAPIDHDPLHYGMGLVLQNAIEGAGSVDDIEGIKQLLDNTNIETAVGGVSFDPVGRNVGSTLILFQNNAESVRKIISPLASANAEFVYPMPTWDERIEDIKFLKYESEMIVLIITSVAIFIVLIYLVLNIICRNVQAIRVSQPIFLGIFLIGSILFLSSNYFWLLYETNVSCLMRRWTLTIGFTMMFGSLFSRIYRIKSIFKVKVDDPVITLQQLLMIVGILIGIDVVLLTLWTIVSPSTYEKVIPDPDRPILNYRICTNTLTDDVFFYIIIGEKVITILYGIYLSIQTWSLKFKIFNESKYIAFSIYNCLFFFLLSAVTYMIEDREISMYIRCFVVVAVNIICTSTIMIPKFYYAVSGYQIAWGNRLSSSNSGSKRSNIPSNGYKLSDDPKQMQYYMEELNRYRVKYGLLPSEDSSSTIVSRTETSSISTSSQETSRLKRNNSDNETERIQDLEERLKRYENNYGLLSSEEASTSCIEDFLIENTSEPSYSTGIDSISAIS
eukprot:TRINITY_DN2235_c0_g2_i3.p1 TRINITY_DN2235_c0_g2~~TRINITY_DN2235_c0_g2_i3.p1  ORF type:complete len:682 (-),score=109.42 TRINITY_DN2235_c0_g2_i3:54-2099(-)